MTTPSGEDGFDNQPARFGISPNPLTGDTPAALVGRTQEFIEQKLKQQYVAGGPSIWALGQGTPLQVAQNVLNAVFKAILGALDPHNLPTPEQVWQTITDVFLAPLNWLHNIPIGAITASTPNMLADFITADSLVGDTTWVFDSTAKPAGAVGSARITFDGAIHELISERILLDVGRKVDASVKIKYSGVTASTGSPIRLSWIGWNGDDEVAGGDFAVHQPSGAALDWTTLSGSLTRLESDPWDRVSIVLKTMAGATAGTVWFGAPSGKKPDKLPKNLVDGLESALAAAGQSIRDAICNALGLGGSGHTDADVIHALTNIPKQAVEGVVDLADDVRDGFAAWWNKFFNRSDGTGSVAQIEQVAEAIRVAVSNGWTLQTEVTNGTWAVPAGITECHGITLGGGDCGFVGQVGSGTRIGGARTNGGPYVSRQLDLSVLIPGEAVLTHIVGTAGSTAGALGGVSQIKDSAGNILVSSGAGLGGVALPQGMLATTSSAGYGGKGGDATTSPSATAGEDGGSSGTASGGTGGQPRTASSGGGSMTGRPGGDGSPGQTTTVPIVGGSGGAGGGGIGTNVNTWAVRGGDGGDGGWPGGAGGSSGAAAGLLNFSAGSFGLGAPGMVAYLYK